MIDRLAHRVAHLLHRNQGHVVSGTDQHGMWVAFECAGCGEIQGKEYCKVDWDRVEPIIHEHQHPDGETPEH